MQAKCFFAGAENYLIHHPACIPKMTPGGATEPSGRIQYHLSQARHADLNVLVLFLNQRQMCQVISEDSVSMWESVKNRFALVQDGVVSRSSFPRDEHGSPQNPFPESSLGGPIPKMLMGPQYPKCHGASVAACAICLVFLSAGRRSLRGENYLSFSIGYSFKRGLVYVTIIGTRKLCI